MSIVREIEEAIIAAIKAAAPGVAVVGLREAFASGVKETPGGPEIRVTVSPLSCESYASPVVETACKVNVHMPLEDDPALAAYDDLAAVIEELVLDFNDAANLDAMAAALTTEHFRCDGFRTDGGEDSLDLSREAPAISTTYSFTLKGVLTTNNGAE